MIDKQLIGLADPSTIPKLSFATARLREAVRRAPCRSEIKILLTERLMREVLKVVFSIIALVATAQQRAASVPDPNRQRALELEQQGNLGGAETAWKEASRAASPVGEGPRAIRCSATGSGTRRLTPLGSPEPNP